MRPTFLRCLVSTLLFECDRGSYFKVLGLATLSLGPSATLLGYYAYTSAAIDAANPDVLAPLWLRSSSV